MEQRNEAQKSEMSKLTGRWHEGYKIFARGRVVDGKLPSLFRSYKKASKT